MPTNWIQVVRDCFAGDAVLYSGHARREMLAEEFGIITDSDVGEAMKSPEILEDYPDDHPYPSCLLLGFTKVNRPLHLVVAFDETELKIIVVTVYHPDTDRWDDYRRRK